MRIFSQDRTQTLFQGSFQEFRKFRCIIAKYLKCKEYVKLWPVPGFPGNSKVIRMLCRISKRKPSEYTTWQKLDIEKKKLTLPGSVSFLFHSDMDGSWTEEECQHIYQLLVRMSLDIMISYPSVRSMFNQFTDGLQYCQDNHQKAIFVNNE